MGIALQAKATASCTLRLVTFTQPVLLTVLYVTILRYACARKGPDIDSSASFCNASDNDLGMVSRTQLDTAFLGVFHDIWH